MSKVKWSVASRRRRKRVLKATKGAYGARSKLYQIAREHLDRSLAYATRDRRVRKRQFRALWIMRINAACREQGLTYSELMRGLKAAKVSLDRKHLADLAATDAAAFQSLVALACLPAAARQQAGQGAPAKA